MSDLPIPKNCPTCEGSGRLWTKREWISCQPCGGTGRGDLHHAWIERIDPGMAQRVYRYIAREAERKRGEALRQRAKRLDGSREMVGR